jgi:hypothetical protein
VAGPTIRADKDPDKQGVDNRKDPVVSPAFPQAKAQPRSADKGRRPAVAAVAARAAFR